MTASLRSVLALRLVFLCVAAIACGRGLPSAAPCSAAVASPSAAPPPAFAAFAAPALTSRAVYVGSYTAPGTAPGGHAPSTAVGISAFRMRVADGALVPVQVVPIDNPSFLALDASSSHLYATIENGLAGGQPGGRVAAYAVDAKTGRLEFIDAQSTAGTYPAHLSVHPSGKFLLGSNYGNGTFPVYRLNAGGAIGPMTADAPGVGNGTGPRPDRQEGPHAHQIVADLDGRCVFGVDLGADRLYAWTLDDAGKLAPASVPYASVPSGSGPRHLAFHPNRRFVYVLSELSSTIAVFRYDPARCALVFAELVSMLPPDYAGPNAAAEIRVHPSGRFLYATNRGHNTVVEYAVDPERGTLDTIGWESTRGDWPRGMNLDPSGTFLYVANQNSDSIVVFRVDPARGALAPTGAVVRTPTPADVEFGAPVAE